MCISLMTIDTGWFLLVVLSPSSLVEFLYKSFWLFLNWVFDLLIIDF